MAKVIIGIHGLGNKPPKKLLEDWWRNAMLEGLHQLNKPYVLPKFELVYWADILYEKPLDELVSDSKDPYFIKQKYNPRQQEFKPQDHSVRQKILDFLEPQLDKLFLNSDLTFNYSGITNAFLRRYFRDLELYYDQEYMDENVIRRNPRKLIRERLVAVLQNCKNDEIFLISHSMGSIIAYDVLTFLLPDFNIHTFVSMGSPLGFPVVQGKIAAEWHSKKQYPLKLATPPGVKKHWYNFSDLLDNVAMIYKLKENYHHNLYGVIVEDFVVNNDYKIGNYFNPHQAYGYLRVPKFSEVLYHFSERKSWAKRLFSKISSLRIFRTLIVK